VIKELQLKNFRGFQDHTICFQPTTIIVGKNNAGKSTIVEALRLISIVVNRFEDIPYSDLPRYWNFPKTHRGFSPYKNLEINLKSIFYSYGQPPAEIRATLDQGEEIFVSIYEDFIKAGIKTPGRGQHSSRTALPKISILPQVAPFATEERVLTPEYVKGALSSSLAPIHFRNQVFLLKNFYKDFKQITEATWPGLRIESLVVQGTPPDPVHLSLIVRDGGFSAEVAWMGHGLQMWLQTMWFLARAKKHDTVILDEPDVYMHADLQRRLIRFLRNRYPQIIIATHSSEIMAEVEPENILIIDRQKAKSTFAPTLPAVQKVLNTIGSVHNLQLSRLWTSRRFLMVEGEDIAILKRFQNTLFPDATIPLDVIPSMSVGGWGGWNYAVGSSMFLENAVGEGITTYCVLDSDYHTNEEIEARIKDAKTRGVQLHIWKRKEIENYLLIPQAIHRVVAANVAKNKPVPTALEITAQLEIIAESLKDEVLDSSASAIQHRNKGMDAGTANKKARERIEKSWKTVEERLSLVSGKRALSALSEWSNKNYGVSFSSLRVASELRAGEIDDEVKSVLKAIEEIESF